MDMSKLIDWIGNLLSHVPFSFAKGNNNVFIVLTIHMSAMVVAC
jgi:hypothetical protein